MGNTEVMQVQIGEGVRREEDGEAEDQKGVAFAGGRECSGEGGKDLGEDERKGGPACQITECMAPLSWFPLWMSSALAEPPILGPRTRLVLRAASAGSQLAAAARDPRPGSGN